MTPLFDKLEELMTLDRGSFIRTKRECVSDYDSKFTVPVGTLIRVDFYYVGGYGMYGIAEINEELVKVNIEGPGVVDVEIVKKIVRPKDDYNPMDDIDPGWAD